MRFEEFETASLKTLRREAKFCFSEYQDPNTGGMDKPALLLEAQFYMNEMDRRHGNRVANRDLILELIVIALILGEIIMSVYEGNIQAKLIAQENAVLQHLDDSTKKTAESMGTLLSLQYRVFVKLLPAMTTFQVFNNSDNEVTIWGIKVGNLPARSIDADGMTIPGHVMDSILLEKVYPRLFTRYPKVGAVPELVTIYLKGTNGEEYVIQGTFDFSGNMGGTIASGSGAQRKEEWSDKVTFSQAPSRTPKASLRKQTP